MATIFPDHLKPPLALVLEHEPSQFKENSNTDNRRFIDRQTERIVKETIAEYKKRGAIDSTVVDDDDPSFATPPKNVTIHRLNFRSVGKGQPHLFVLDDE